tara:strand:- start:963 stop:2045 length:1083 start_codon:yes stop_codon:yes gene_type:complete
MLQATYKDNTYTFYVTLKDAEQYIDGVRFDVPIVGDRYLFKFTNDMSGEVKWSYGKLITINNRYAELQVSNSSLADESVYDGKVNFEPNGFWKYEIFWMYDNIKGGTPLDCRLFNPSETGTWEATNLGGTVKNIGTLDVDVFELNNLPEDTYYIKEYSTCEPPPAFVDPSSVNTLTQVLSRVLCATSKRDLLFTQVVRNKETTSFHINSVATIGQEIRFVSSTRTYSHIVTTLPESFVMTVETGSGVEDSKEYQVYVYNGSSLVFQYNNAIAVRNPQQFRGGYIMASNNEWENTSCGTIVNGNIFFTWNKTGNSPNSGYITEYEAPIEIGKLLIGEPQGDEQVQYKQHEAPNDTNYIYND